MALKKRIDKAAFDALKPEFQAEYKAGGTGDEGHYVLEVEGEEDVGALRRANDRNKLEADQAKAKAAKAEADLAELQRVSQRGTGDIAALEKSWKTEAEARENAAKGETKKVKAKLGKLLVTDVAHRIASKISTSPDLILPHIERRLKAEIPEGDEDPLTRVLDADGKPSALSIEQLEQEFVANPKFAGIIVASRASGGGANGNHSGGAAKKPNEYTGAEKIALFKSDPEGFKKLFPTVN